MPETLSECMQLPFKIDDRIDPGLITVHAGVPRKSSMTRFRSNSGSGA